MKTKILQKDAPVLRQVAQSVPAEDIGSKKILNIISRMEEALHAEEDGVAIAAPQIGESLRIFVVNGKLFGSEDLIFINPEIVKTSKHKIRMEEGCLSVRWLYGKVLRSEKVIVRAHDKYGRKFELGASDLLAQIFQHEIDHLNGILFIDKAKDIEDLPPSQKTTASGEAPLKAVVKFVFFGSSQFSAYVLDELEKAGYSPALEISSAKEPLPSLEELREISADVFIVASFGKILPKEIIDLPKHGSLNVHPSLLPKLRGPSPIQNTILGRGEPGVTIMKMDEKMDNGPLLAQEKVKINPWPTHYKVTEEILGRAGGKLLGKILEPWILGEIEAKPQNSDEATFTKFIKKEDGLLNLDDPAETNLRKVFAYSTWPGAYIMFSATKGGSASGGKRYEIRVMIKDAEIRDGKFIPTRVIPAGKREMNWQDFLRGN